MSVSVGDVLAPTCVGSVGLLRRLVVCQVHADGSANVTWRHAGQVHCLRLSRDELEGPQLVVVKRARSADVRRTR